MRASFAIASVALTAVIAAVASCQVVAGVESRNTDPLLPGCALATTGPARVRYANLVPSTDRVDICIRSAGAASYGRPVYRGGGTDCAAGLGYAEVSAPLGAPATSVDIKLVPSGSTCGATALSESLGVALSSNSITTILRIGGAGTPEQIVRLAEEPTPDASNTRIRFVHAAPGLKSLVFGIAKDAHLPTSIVQPLFAKPVPFGHVPPPNEKPAVGTLDAASYIVTAAFGFNVGAAEDGSDKAILDRQIPNSAATYTLYAIGAPGSNNQYPVRGLLCDDLALDTKDATKTLCTPTDLATISMTAFNVSLYGPNANFEDVRRPYLYNAIAKDSADFMCLMEVSRQSDRDGFTAAASPANGGNFPYAYAPTTDLTTPFTDPTDQNGMTPPTPTSPPCGSDVPTQTLDDLYSCLESKCSDKPPGDPTGKLNQSTDCLSHGCAIQFVPLLNNYQSCFACIVDNVESQNEYGASRTSCTTDTHAPMVFGGQNPSMILSRYPLSKQDMFVLPSTNFRRSILYAQAQLEDQAVDVYCGFYTSTLIDTTIPYTGNYGNGDSEGYHNEQLLQADRLVAWVKQKSGDRPAIIAGDWHASAASMDGSIAGLNSDTLQKMRNAFSVAQSAAWTPQCSNCPGSINPYNGDTKGYFFHETYVANWPANSTVDESIAFNQAIVPLPNNGGNGMLSVYFGHNVKVLRPR